MQIEPNLIRAERERRAWSQQHLATVSGLSLRTIQRVEQTGAASFETAAALAACLDLSLTSLANSVPPPLRPVATMRRSTAWIGMAVAFMAGMIVTVSQPVVAEDVAFDVSVRRFAGDDAGADGVIVGESYEVRLDNDEFWELSVSADYGIRLAPRVVDGHVVLTLELPEGKGPPMLRRFQSVVFVKDEQPFWMQFGSHTAYIRGLPLGPGEESGAAAGDQPEYIVRLVPKILAR